MVFYIFSLYIFRCSRRDECCSSSCEQLFFCLFYVDFHIFSLYSYHCSRCDECCSSPCEQLLFCLFYVSFDGLNCEESTAHIVIRQENLSFTAHHMSSGISRKYAIFLDLSVCRNRKNGYFTLLDCSPCELHKFSNLCYDIITVKGRELTKPPSKTENNTPLPDAYGKWMFIQATTSCTV